MNLTCGARTIKYLILSFNFFFVITGIVLIAVGATIASLYSDYHLFLNGNYFSLPNLLIATGCLIFFISFVGCYGAMKQSWVMLAAFSVLLFVIFIFEFSAGIAGYVLRDKTSSYIESTLRESMGDYNNNNTAVTKLWDTIQKEFECCGVNNYTDWNIKMTGINGSLPISCCPSQIGVVGQFNCTIYVNQTVTPENSTTSTTAPYTTGCEVAFGDYIKVHAIDIGGVGVAFAVIQIVAIAFSCFLSRQLKNSYYST